MFCPMRASSSPPRESSWGLRGHRGKVTDKYQYGRVTTSVIIFIRSQSQWENEQEILIGVSVGKLDKTVS